MSARVLRRSLRFFLLALLVTGGWPQVGCAPKTEKAGSTGPAAKNATITFYGFSILGEVMNNGVFPAFQKKWTAEGHGAVEFRSSFGGSGTIVLTSSRDAADFGPLVGACGARGFVPKAELSGAALHAVLR